MIISAFGGDLGHFKDNLAQFGVEFGHFKLIWRSLKWIWVTLKS